MFTKYLRQKNSEKYHDKLSINQLQCFDVSLAQMDIGKFQPLHHNITKVLSSYVLSSKNKSKYVQQKAYQQLIATTKQSIISWFNKEHNCKLCIQDNSVQQMTSVIIEFVPSIVTAISYCIMALTDLNDKVLIFTPVYAAYINQIIALNRQVQTCNLILNKHTNNQGVVQIKMSIDFIQLQNKINKGVKMVIVSQSHNPGGRLWRQNQIQNIINICQKKNIKIVSDEVLFDLSLTDLASKQIKDTGIERSFAYYLNKYDNVIVANNIGKAFNYSSVQGGYLIFRDTAMNIRKTVHSQFNDKIDPLALSCIIGSLGHYGKYWLRYTKNIIYENYQKLLTFISVKAPLLQISQLEAAYIIYMNFSFYFGSISELRRALKQNNIWVTQLGNNYYRNKNQCLQIRICIACQPQQFQRFIKQLGKVIESSTMINNKIKPNL